MRSTVLALVLGSLNLASASPQDAPPIRFGDPDELAYDAPFFPGATYDPAVPTPESVLGQPLGSRLSHHDEILAIFRALAEASPRVTLERHGITHEGRPLVHAVVTSEANQANRVRIQGDLARLHDPRGLSDAEAKTILDRVPPVAWMAYSIHGDELSGCDAGVALAYHLAASTDQATLDLLEDVVVVIDPNQNPDGRERIVSMVEQSAGYTPNLDYASMHRGRWPYGRGNHYLFDMNRDWMPGTQPETRGRWRAVLSWHPQLFVDAHEMGSLDTFLFYPQEKPLNPFLPERHAHWHGVYAADAGRAFDEEGWGYYTREWADGWAPFYSDAWSSLTGALGILYEQSSTSGFPLMRASGEVMTYRESVHHQAAASLANLGTLRANRRTILEDYLANGRRNVSPDTPGNERALVFSLDRNPERGTKLASMLAGQGVELFGVAGELETKDVVSHLGEREDTRTFPGTGTIVVPARQPMAQIVKAFLTFDLRMDAEALKAEREELERKGQTKIYDLTAWSLPHALDVDSWWCEVTAGDLVRVSFARPTGEVTANPDPSVAPYAWAVDASHDACARLAVRAMENGLAVHVSDEPFTLAGETFPRGSVLVRRHENEVAGVDAAGIAARVARSATEARARVVTGSTGRSPDEGPDLGGQHFRLLSRPRVAMLANSPVASDTYGHLWHHLDTELGVPFTLLDCQDLSFADLRRYNVLIVPPGGVGGVLGPRKEALETWVEGGGTLIAIGSAAATVSGSLELSSVVLRRNALEDLDDYRTAVERERHARSVEIDPALVWGDQVVEASADEEATPEGEPEDEPSDPTKDEDAWMRTFSPYGVNLLAEVNQDAWITAGCPERMPVYFSGARVYLSKPPVTTALRLRPADELRLGGLVWPEARERLGDSAYLTVESKGSGQVILFAAMPAYRGYHAGTARLFSNAVAYGPGLGADQPLGW